MPKVTKNFNYYIIRNRYTRIAGISASVVLLLLSALTVYPIVKNLNTAEAATAQDSTTTLEVATGAAASVNLLVQDSAGTFAKSTDSQLANFSVTTNNGSGYNLIIKGKDNTYNKLSNASTSVTLNSISSTMSESSFESYSLSSNQGIFGYKPSKLNSAVNSNYKGAPDNTTGDIIEKTSIANSTANNYTIGLGVKANYNTPAGTYTNTYVITATGNGTPYSITYADNTGDTISGMPARQYSDTGITDTSVTLSSATPTRSGYTFLRWCEGTVSNNGTTCSGTTYNSGASYGINRQATSNSTTLYAVWSPTITIKSVDGLTNVSLNGTTCTNTSTGCTVTGMENGKQANLVATISNTNKHSFNTWTKSNTATGTGTIGNASTASTTYTVGSLPITITPSLTINQYTCTKQYRLQNADGSWGSYTTDSTEQVEYDATCSYSKTVTNYKGSESGTNGSAGTASGKMTEAGLTLQVSMYRNTYTVSVSNTNTTSGASSLTVRYGGSATVTVTPSSGYYLSAVSCPSGYTCTGYNTGTSYTSQQTVTVTNNNSTNTSNTLSFTGATAKLYMQNVTSSTCTTTAQTVYDNRDEQAYTIQKLADGKCWMMTNLNLGAVTLTTDLTSANTNLSTTITASTWNGHKKSSGTATYTAAEYIPLTGTDSTSGTAYGTLYNYCAASAKTICTSSNSNNASYDICPKGWRLPTGNTSGEFQALYNNTSYNSNAKMRAPVSSGGAAFALAGYFYSSTPTDQGSCGYYWSSTRLNYGSMYLLSLDTSNVNPASNDGRYGGYSIRCVLK